MVSRLKQLRLSRSEGKTDFNRSFSRKNYGTRSKSPTEEDIERIINDYIDEDFKRSVITKDTAKLAVESLEKGYAIRGLTSDFSNFISSIGKERMVEKVYDMFYEENLLNLLNQDLKLKTKTIKGFALDNKVYLRQTKVGLRAYRFKDNKFAKIPKNLFRK